jgi:hypothetical protein
MADEKEVRSELIENEEPPVMTDAELDAMFEDDEDVDVQESKTAPWSGVPLWIARNKIQRDQAWDMDVIFPEVYAEDRTSKLKDLATAQAVGAITHQRMAEQMAKELGFDDYDYASEIAAIKNEQETLPPSLLGVADAVAGAPSKPAGNPAPPGGWVPAPEQETPMYPRRYDLSGAATARFRKLQRK